MMTTIQCEKRFEELSADLLMTPPKIREAAIFWLGKLYPQATYPLRRKIQNALINKTHNEDTEVKQEALRVIDQITRSYISITLPLDESSCLRLLKRIVKCRDTIIKIDEALDFSTKRAYDLEVLKIIGAACSVNKQAEMLYVLLKKWSGLQKQAGWKKDNEKHENNVNGGIA